MNKALNIVHLVSNRVWGGGEQYVLDLCRALEADGHSVAVVTRGYKDVDRHFAEAGFAPGKLPLKGRLDFISPIVLARVLNRMEAPIVVHAHNFKDADTAVRARRLMACPSKVRIVVTRHLAKAGGTGRYAEDLYAGIDALVFVSETARKEFLSTSPVIRPSKMHVIYNAITLAPKVVASCGSEADGSVTLFYAGRISPEKGLEVLIRAMEKLPENIRLLVAGQGRSRDVLPLMKLARTLDLDGRIEWLGHVDDIASQMAAADIGVVPTVAKEAFGLSVLEFMSQGVPVVATNNGGPSEIITDGIDGFLVPPSDPEALASAISRLANDAPLCSRMGAKAAAVVVERFSYPQFYRQILDVYTAQ